MKFRKEVIGFILILSVFLSPNIILAASITGRLINQISKIPIGTSGRLALYMYKEDEGEHHWVQIASTSPNFLDYFSFSGLEAGTYVIYGEYSGYHPEWYDDVQVSESALPP